MILLEKLYNEKEWVVEGLKKKNFKDLHLVDDIILLDTRKKELKTSLDNLNAKRNSDSKIIGQLMKEGKKEEVEAVKSELSFIKDEIANTEEQLKIVEKELFDELVKLPNTPHTSVPKGITPEENEIVASWGEIPTLNDKALEHWDLAKKYELFDLELGVKLTGSGFPVYTGKGAKLQRALISYFLDKAEEAGYNEVIPPLLVNEESAFATGQLPDKEGQMYHATADNFYLIPTAEVPITNIFRDVILAEKDLPQKRAGYTPCFRREAGSYGKDVRGLNRVHQFDKVEIVQIAHPDKSYEVLEDMVKHVASILQSLGLPYRILRLCGGDMSFASALTYDFEVYSAAQKRWLEVSSVSNFETFQSNRLKLRFKDSEGKNRLAHTLNGSALALARIVACLLENNQTEEGIVLPEVLRSYTRFDVIN
jgi:seryl-tRNA synthetase